MLKPKVWKIPTRYEAIATLHTFVNTDDARAFVWQAVLRGAYVTAWLCTSGDWQVSINEKIG